MRSRILPKRADMHPGLDDNRQALLWPDQFKASGLVGDEPPRLLGHPDGSQDPPTQITPSYGFSNSPGKGSAFRLNAPGGAPPAAPPRAHDWSILEER
jgi:hypothetical protein